jgi:hypothetical protein
MTHTCARLKRRRHDQLNLINPYGLIAILSDQSAGRRFVKRATQSSGMIQRVLKSRRENAHAATRLSIRMSTIWRLWHNAKFSCHAKLARYRGMADIEQAASVRAQLKGSPLLGPTVGAELQMPHAIWLKLRIGPADRRRTRLTVEVGGKKGYHSRIFPLPPGRTGRPP